MCRPFESGQGRHFFLRIPASSNSSYSIHSLRNPVTVPKLCPRRAQHFLYQPSCVRLNGNISPPGPHRRSYAKAEVEVRQLLDGSWRVYSHDQLIARHPSTELRDPVRALAHNRRIKGASSDQWVYLASASQPQAPQADL